MRLMIHYIGAAAFAAAAAFAQVPVHEDVMVMAGPVPGAATGMAMTIAEGQAGPQHTTIGFVSSVSVFGEKTVTGAPYSAEGVTEYTRTLADGTHIKRTSTSAIYRDSLGRTRQEHSVQIMGPLAATGEPAKTITITDPVARVVYILNPAEKTATQLPFPSSSGQNVTWAQSGTSATIVGKTETFEKRIHIRSADTAGGATVVRHGDFKTESLGKRVIEGVSAEGTRTSSEIPEGQIGNDRPIAIVTETWNSPELKTVVLSQTTDPMNGDTTYRLTNINRTEPPADLFQVPADYTLKTAPQRRATSIHTAPNVK